MKTKRLGLEVSLKVLIVLGALSLLNACGGSPSAPVSPPPQGKPGTPQAQPLTPPQTQPVIPPVVQPPTPPTVQPPSGTSTGTEIKVTLKDRTFPKEIRVRAGDKVVFLVTNAGTVMHTFEFPDFDEMRYKEIEVGRTMRIEWVVPNKKGKWDMGCFLTEEGFHEGMEGILFIE